jgi:cytochrome c peroxidase
MKASYPTHISAAFLIFTALNCAFVSAATPEPAKPAATNSAALIKNKKAPSIDSIAKLGEHLFFDTNFSKNRTQSCATCHAPSAGFADPRDNGVNGSASLGDNGTSLGDRNTPAIGYVSFTPDFGHDQEGNIIGGQFWDGRAHDLKEQAGGPLLNDIEMALDNRTEVLNRINENPLYIQTFKNLFSEDILNNADHAFTAMTTALEYFEKTDFFSPFDSKYDRYLNGEYALTKQEDLGMTIFFSQQFSNCNACHQLNARPNAKHETFSDYRYHNIGVPENKQLREANKLGAGYQDKGLFHNPDINDESLAGKFKTPSLRNVAVTGPYMHNGVFQDLRTVVSFYNKYNSKSPQRQIDPETGETWAKPEVPENISLQELREGPALDDRRIDALVAFMKILTDKRFEHLLPKDTSQQN